MDATELVQWGNYSFGADYVLSTLTAAGYEAYLVGGCVRDLLRGVEPHDWDICTAARPEQVQACFDGQRIIETGLKHGTVTLVISGEHYEVTTYRTDGVYSDGRHPDKVEFVSNLTDDLARRDFTMNAVAMSVDGTVHDPFFGAEDIQARTIRCVGHPDCRFSEDGLRIMRALRFAAVLGYSIEEETAGSIHRNKHMLSNVAAERIQVELCKLLTGDNAGAVLREYVDVLCEFWPELGSMVGMEQHNPWHCYDVWNHTVAAVESAPQDVTLRLTMLFHDVGKPQCFMLDGGGVGHFYGHSAVGARQADDMLHRLKFDNGTRGQVVELIEKHDVELILEEKIIRRWLNRLGEERFTQLLEVKRADCMAQRPEVVPDRLLQLERIRRKMNEILEANQCVSLKDLAVDGRDVIAAGISPGPEVGAVLNALMDRVMDGQLPNEREILLAEIGPVG